MDGQYGYEHLMPFISLATSVDANNVAHLRQDYLNQHYYAMEVGSNQMPPVPSSLPHWINFLQTPHNYVEYIAECRGTGVQKKVPYNEPEAVSGFNLADYSVGTSFPEEQKSNALQSGVSVAAPLYPRKARDHISRRRATNADRARRLRIAERLDALNDLLPHPNKGGKASLLEDLIDHIKYLQLQIKDLSQSRLGGESTSNPFIFLKGYGHYLVHEQIMSNEPLEEMIGKLLEVNPSAAIQLLESRGLYILPMFLAEGLHHTK